MPGPYRGPAFNIPKPTGATASSGRKPSYKDNPIIQKSIDRALSIFRSKSVNTGYEYKLGGVTEGSIKIDVLKGGKQHAVYSIPSPITFGDHGEIRGTFAGVNVLSRTASGAYTHLDPLNYIGAGFKPGMTGSQFYAMSREATKALRWDAAHYGMSQSALPHIRKHQYIGGPQLPVHLLKNPQEAWRVHQQNIRDIGIKGLKTDAAVDAGLVHGKYSTLSVRNIDFFGGLQKGGYKVLQTHATLPMSVIRHGEGIDPQTFFPTLSKHQAHKLYTAGRLFQTSAMDVTDTSLYKGGPVPQGLKRTGLLNVPHRVLFGEAAAAVFTEENQAVYAREYVGDMARRINRGPDYRGLNVGSAIHGFFKKKNIAGMRSIRDQKFFKGAAAVVPGAADLASNVEVLLGAYTHRLVSTGMGLDEITKGMREALSPWVDMSKKGLVFRQSPFGTSLPADFASMTDSQVSALALKQQHQIVGQVKDVFGRVQKQFGHKFSDLIGSEIGLKGGQVSEVLSIGGVGQRIQDDYTIRGTKEARSLSRGIRVSDSMISTARMYGSDELVELLSEFRRDPRRRKHLEFRSKAMDRLQHLLPDTHGKHVSTPSKFTGRGAKWDTFLSGHVDEFTSFMAAEKLRIQSGGSGALEGFSARLYDWSKEHGADKISRLYEVGTPGTMISMGQQVDVAADVTLAGHTQRIMGKIGHVPIANLALAGSDTYAWRAARFLEEGPASGAVVSELTRENIQLFTAGKTSRYGSVSRDRLGHVISARIQTPFSVGDVAPEDAFKQQVQRILGKKTRMDDMAQYVVLDSKHKKMLTDSQLAFLKKHKYVHGLAIRYPETGHSMAAVRMVFDDKLGKVGARMSAALSSFLGADVDADDALFKVADGKRWVDALKETEAKTYHLIRRQAELKARSMAGVFTGAGDAMTQLVNFVTGKISDDMATPLAEKSSSVAQWKSLLDAQETKSLTGQVDIPTKWMLDAWTVAGKHGAMNLDKSGMAMATEIIPALIESTISKHEGTNTLEHIKSMNTIIKRMGNNMKDVDRTAARNHFINAVSESITIQHRRRAAGLFAEGLSGFAGGDSLQQLMYSTDSASVIQPKVHEFFSKGPGASVIDELMVGNIYAVRAQQVAADMSAVHSKLTGPSSVVKAQRSMYQTGAHADPIIDEILELRGYKEAGGRPFVPAETPTPTPPPQGAKSPLTADDAWGSMKQWAYKTADKYPGRTAAGLGAAALFTGIAAFQTLSRPVNTAMEHIAQQANPVNLMPQTKYIQNPVDSWGHDLYMSGTVTPEAMMYARQVFNETPGNHNIRVMNSSFTPTDRTMGRMADAKAQSAYGRSYI